MGSNFMKWFGENCACPVRTIRRCFICKVPSTSSVLLHINDLFLDPPLELAKKLAQLGAGVHGDVQAASFLVQSVYLVPWLCFVPMQKWSQVDDRTKVFLSRFWCFSGSWNLLRPKAEFTKQMLSKISVCVIGNTQQPPKAYVIAPPLLAPEDQRRPRAAYKKVFAFPLREMPSQPKPDWHSRSPSNKMQRALRI